LVIILKNFSTIRKFSKSLKLGAADFCNDC
jgi:hypothetical protein